MEWTLVTGGAKRLGAEICQTLAKNGFSILIHYRSSKNEACEILKQCLLYGVPAEIVQGDFSSPKSTEEFISRCKRDFPDIKNIINNVGNYLIKPISETSIDEWTQIFQTNLHAPFAISTALLKSLKKFRGNLINIGVSGISNFRAEISRNAYTTSKMALWMFTKSLAKEMAPFDVRVNMVSPGYIENAIDLPQDLNKLPLGRPALVKEVVRVIEFLLDQDSKYITGQNIEVSGGVGL